MRELSRREKRTLRIGAVVVLAYLGALYGARGWRWLEAERAEADALRLEAERVQLEVLAEEAKRERLGMLAERLGIDRKSLRSDELVATARSEIHALALAQKVKLATERELEGNVRGGELRRFHLGGTGPSLSVAGFVYGLEALGVPLLIESLRLETEGMPGGHLRFSLEASLIDFGSWKKPEKRNA